MCQAGLETGDWRPSSWGRRPFGHPGLQAFQLSQWPNAQWPNCRTATLGRMVRDGPENMAFGFIGWRGKPVMGTGCAECCLAFELMLSGATIRFAAVTDILRPQFGFREHGTEGRVGPDRRRGTGLWSPANQQPHNNVAGTKLTSTKQTHIKPQSVAHRSHPTKPTSSISLFV